MKALLLLSMPLLILARACGSAPESLPPPRDGDGGFAGRDATSGDVPDAAAGADTGAPVSFDEAAAGGRACFDGEDTGETGADCDDASCLSAVNACCVGNGSCCGPDGAFAGIAAGFDGCTGSVETCVGDARFRGFGMPAAHVRDGFFLPGGDAEYDSGAELTERIDLTTRRVGVEAVINPSTGCDSSCLDAVAIALTMQRDIGTTTTIRPVVGVLYSGARHRLSLVINGVPVDSRAFDTRAKIRLEVEPAGTVILRDVTASPEGVELARATYTPIADATLVLYGRTRNLMGGTAAPESASIDDLVVTREVCDAPRAWVRPESALVLQEPGRIAWNRPVVRAPSGWPDGGYVYLAFDTPSGLQFGRWDPGDAGVVTIYNTAEVGGGAGSFDDDGAREPALVRDGDTWVVFYTGIEGDKRSIGVATAPAAMFGRFVPEAAPVIAPSEGAGELAIDSPSVLIPPTGPWQMIARLRRSDGSDQLVRYVRDAGTLAWSRVGGAADAELAGLATLTRRPGSSGSDAFDRDELTGPALVAQNGTYQLYYSGRIGSRWGIGQLASDDLDLWVQVGDGQAVLAGDGSGFDAFGVGDPSVVVDEAAGIAHLFYAGSDGARSWLAHATRETATHRSAGLHGF